MKRTIWKFPLRVDDHVAIEMPMASKVLCVQVQLGTPCLWALVYPDAKMETRDFRVIGTGHPIERDPGDYIGTFQLNGGALVFHVFEP
jgi:hypothetical protein